MWISLFLVNRADVENREHCALSLKKKTNEQSLLLLFSVKMQISHSLWICWLGFVSSGPWHCYYIFSQGILFFFFRLIKSLIDRAFLLVLLQQFSFGSFCFAVKFLKNDSFCLYHSSFLISLTSINTERLFF